MKEQKAETYADLSTYQYTTLHLRLEQEASELLGIPAHMSQAGLLPVAYTKGTDFKPASRPPVEEITYLDNYKNPIR